MLQLIFEWPRASAWFIAYGVASIPAAALLGRLGYSQAIIVALVTMVAGCLIVPIATLADFYPGVLIALFVIASGVTLLQVGANPLVAALGNPKSSHARLNFSQFFNSLGTTLGPLIAAPILLTGTMAWFTADGAPVHFPGAAFVVAAIFGLLAILMLRRLPRATQTVDQMPPSVTA